MDLTDWNESALPGRSGLNSPGSNPRSLPAAIQSPDKEQDFATPSIAVHAFSSRAAGAPLPWPYAHGREIDEPWTYPAAMAVVCLGLLAGVIGVAMAIAYVVPQVAR